MSTADRMREIDREINLLQSERRQLLLNEVKKFQDEHRHNIGRCFKTPGGRCAIITGVPGIKRNPGFDVTFNQHQFPALILERLTDEEVVIPFSDDTIFSGNGTDFGVDPLIGRSNYQEITPEEFSDEFEKRVNALRAIIDKATIQEES